MSLFLRMLKDQCISITDLRRKTKECLKGLNKHEKFIFVNNQPVAVLLSIDSYEEYMKDYHRLQPLPADEITPKMLAAIEKAKRTPRSQLHNL